MSKGKKSRGRAVGSGAISPEELLRRMEDPNYPSSVVRILQQAGSSYRVVAHWRQNPNDNPDLRGFDERYRSAMRRMKEKRKGINERSEVKNEQIKSLEEKKRVFIDYFRRTGQEVESCNMAGLRVREVRAFLSPKKEEFDPEFKSQFDDAMAEIKARVADKVLLRAIGPDSNDNMLKFVAQSMMPEQYRRPVVHQHSMRGSVEHRHLSDKRASEFIDKVLDGNVVEGELVEDTKEPGRLPEAVRSDEGPESGGANGDKKVSVSERPVLPAPLRA